MDSIESFTQLSRRVGARHVVWVQGAGGNISVKDRSALTIKASGLRLDDVSYPRGVARLDREVFLARMRDPLDEAAAEQYYADVLRELAEPGWGRPSMETGFHAVLPKKFVVHFHSLAALLMAHERASDRARFEDWLAGTTYAQTLRFVPIARPGLSLVRLLADVADGDAIVLENHGVIVQSDDAALLDRWAEAENQFCDRFGYHELARLNESVDPCAAAFALADAGPLKIYFPDTAVFLDRLQSILSFQGALATLTSEAAQRDRDATELWLATRILHRAQPALPELPIAISADLASLPTEQFRRSLAAKG